MNGPSESLTPGWSLQGTPGLRSGSITTLRTMSTRTLADRRFTATWVSFVAFLAVGVGLRGIVDAEAASRLERTLDWIAGLLLLLTVGSAAVALFSFLIRGR